jgi:ribosomal protein L37AE/L43A
MPEDPPACPGCETDLLVERYAGPEEWLCYGCSRAFDTPAVEAGWREKGGGRV